jgi:hypothetical protein
MIESISNKKYISNKAKKNKKGKQKSYSRNRNISPQKWHQKMFPNPHLGSHGRNIRSTRYGLGGKSRVEVLSLDTQILHLG